MPAKLTGRPLIEVRQLKHIYRSGGEALKGIALTIDAGEMIAVVGRNGAGKTTLTKHFNGLLRPTTGTVLLDGQDTAKLPVAQLARTVGYVFQNPDHQIFHERLFDEIAFGPRNLGLRGDELTTRVDSALKAVDLTDYRDRDPGELSRGQRKRAALASVLAMETAVIILDEPTSGQDYQESEQIMAILQELNRRGHTIIFITHDMELVQEHACRVLLIDDGKLVIDSPPRELFRQEQALTSAGLRLPPTAELEQRLAAFGIHSDAGTVEALAASIARRSSQITARDSFKENCSGGAAACQ
ncbi:ATP-binding cassette domain-containing protein [Heliobacillus mobilis]|uniref:ABC transporter ATP-binding protein n=1 Tax=Heliobacterium mobile TaxID=28064 RepID=A0A6I3SHU2_HELMO|nr:ATP-binding cassette domain-containing protein [Heliobacterium mobile]MTV48396.1 ATP-binding cassette domain-containing protein [Heliobacterium mobile]